MVVLLVYHAYSERSKTMAKSKLLSQVRTEIRHRNYSYRTEQAYASWVVRFVKYCGAKHPNSISENEITDFLNYLPNTGNVAASTQNQSLCALVFCTIRYWSSLCRCLKTRKIAGCPIQSWSNGYIYGTLMGYPCSSPNYYMVPGWEYPKRCACVCSMLILNLIK